MKYAYLSTTAAIIILGFLTIVQIIIVFQKEHEKEQGKQDCSCDHSHAQMTIRMVEKSILVHIVLFSNCFRIIFPNCNVRFRYVKAKGFHFPVAQAESTDPFMRRQF